MRPVQHQEQIATLGITPEQGRERAVDMLRRLRQAGVPIVTGIDAGI